MLTITRKLEFDAGHRIPDHKKGGKVKDSPFEDRGSDNAESANESEQLIEFLTPSQLSGYIPPEGARLIGGIADPGPVADLVHVADKDAIFR